MLFLSPGTNQCLLFTSDSLTDHTSYAMHFTPMESLTLSHLTQASKCNRILSEMIPSVLFIFFLIAAQVLRMPFYVLVCLGFVLLLLYKRKNLRFCSGNLREAVYSVNRTPGKYKMYIYTHSYISLDIYTYYLKCTYFLSCVL